MRFPEIPVALEDTISEGMKVGVRYLLGSKALIGIIVYVAVINFLLNGPLELVIPYVLSITGNELILSVIMAIMSGAAFLGGLLVTIFGLPKNKNRLITLMMSLTGLSMIGFGISRQVLLLGLFLVLCMIPLPVLNAVFRTILQDTVPKHLQGRVFSIAYQVAYGLAPLSFIVVGPLVDQILEPTMLRGSMGLISQLFGDQAGSGMGLLLGFAGGIIVVVTLVFHYRTKIEG